MQQRLQAPATTTTQPLPEETNETPADAPPKQVAMAMESLGRAGRLIADIRIGVDRFLEALFVTAQPHQSNKPLHLILKEEALMRQHLQDLRAIGRQLQDSGVLTASLCLRSNSWGLHMPLVCPDGAVVAYAWKRQLAGQAGASAVDRARLALKAFTGQKRRFFPHLEDEPFGQSSAGESLVLKKRCSSQASIASQKEELIEDKTLSGVLMRLEKEAPNVRIFTYQCLDWLKRAISLLPSAKENSLESSKEHNFNSSNKLRTESLEAVSLDQVAVVELVVPSLFRAIVSLHPPGSIDPDAVAFFSPDEGGSYIHSRGFSVYHLYRHISEHAVKALQYFLGIKTDTTLYLLLHWICSYQTLFTQVCSKCGRLLTMDSASAILLPPVHRPYWHSSGTKSSSIPSSLSTRDQSLDLATAYHIGCSSDQV
ncbi:mediator of RNA polymerase II transcription subunit 27-like [Telopea speciosissima]|uniref:mediator of RNA polymerase II transcription subunit 27-like n=1 Tax=Telopea speciosissima TaxID=54955 RepID=UPI001CC64F87|nr:mediator of RNA polymerase II transcription subunit 27-like [Telopea speciosissima]